MKQKITIHINPGIIPLVGAMVIWGLTFIVTKIALNESGPFTLNVARLGAAWLVLYPFARRQGYRLRDTFKPAFLLFGLTGVAIFYGAETVGLQYTSAASGSLIQAGIPALTAFFSFLLLGERLSLLQSAGVALSVSGVVVITVAGAYNSANDSLLGNLLIVLSLLAWVAYTIQGKKWGGQYPSLVITTASMAAGFLFLLPFGAFEVAANGLPHLTGVGIGSFIYLTLGGSAGAYFLWNYGLKHMNAVEASPYINLIPVVGLVGAMLWGEPVSVFQLAGGAVAILGVWLSGISPRTQAVQVATSQDIEPAA
jgi:drug/metabolite transporter (DMT)-like permease